MCPQLLFSKSTAVVETETPYLIKLSPRFLLSLRNPLFYFLSLWSWATLDTSYKWNLQYLSVWDWLFNEYNKFSRFLHASSSGISSLFLLNDVFHCMKALHLGLSVHPLMDTSPFWLLQQCLLNRDVKIFIVKILAKEVLLGFVLQVELLVIWHLL